MATLSNRVFVFAFAAIFISMAEAQASVGATGGPPQCGTICCPRGQVFENGKCVPLVDTADCGEKCTIVGASDKTNKPPNQVRCEKGATCVNGIYVGQICCPKDHVFQDGKCVPKCDITNVCFAIDQSGSVSTIPEYKLEQDFVKEIAKKIKGNNPSTQLSAVAFSTTATVIQMPTPSLPTCEASVSAPRLFRGVTNIDKGLALCRKILSPQSGKRVIIVLADSGPTDAANAEDTAESIRDERDIYVATVAVDIDRYLLAALAHNRNFVNATTFDYLKTSINMSGMATVVANLICKQTSTNIPTCGERCGSKNPCEKGLFCQRGTCIGSGCYPRGQVSKNGTCVSFVKEAQSLLRSAGEKGEVE